MSSLARTLIFCCSSGVSIDWTFLILATAFRMVEVYNLQPCVSFRDFHEFLRSPTTIRHFNIVGRHDNDVGSLVVSNIAQKR